MAQNSLLTRDITIPLLLMSK